jgi:PAS domain S-box-containing protein
MELVSKLVFDSVSDGIMVINVEDYVVVDANRALLEALKLKAEEAIGRTCFAVTHGRSTPCAAPDVVCPIREMLRTGQPVKVEHAHYDEEGNKFYVQVSATPIRDREGKITQAIHISIEITERKKIEEELWFRAELLDSTSDMVVLRNLSGNAMYVNETTCRILGYSREELMKMNIRELVAPEYAKLFDAQTKELMEKGSLLFESAKICRDGSIIPVEVHASILERKGQKFRLCIIRDITERKKAEELAQESAKKLKSAECLAAIGTTAGMVGHDIRNPLQAIMGDLYLAKADLGEITECKEKKSIQESLEAIAKNAEYINKIVTDLQDFAKPLVPCMEETDLKLIIDEVLQKNVLPESIQPEIELDSNAQKVTTDSSYVERIISNLVSNAVQAMPNGGKLKIRAYRDAKDVVISIEDTGIGIPEEAKGKLFTPLFTTKSKGQGFGLVVVKRMAEALNGTVTFESQVGKGTTFTIRLPPQEVNGKWTFK